MNNILFRCILPSYFIISVVYAILGFFSITLPLDLMQLYLLIGLGYAFNSVTTHQKDSVDSYLIVIIGLTILFSFVSGNPIKVTWYGIRYQLLPISFFFIGKYYCQRDLDFMKYGKYALLFFAIAGLYLFFTSPAWYIAIKSDMVAFDTNEGIGTYMEMLRLTSFSSYPYFVSYGSFILMAYYVSEYVEHLSDKSFPQWKWAIIGLLFVVIILAQQRAPMVGALGIFLYLLFYLRRYSGMGALVTRVALLSILGLTLFYVLSMLLSRLEAGQFDFIMNKITSVTDSGNEFLNERTSMYLNKGYVSSLLGSGIGYHSTGTKIIHDSQFIKSWYELGALLSVLYLLFFYIVSKQCFKRLQYCFFEICVFFFYVLTMIGACSLSNDLCHCMIFWWCCGRLFNKTYPELMNVN